MGTPKRSLVLGRLGLILFALSAGCVSSGSSRREDALRDREAAAPLSDESAYRDAAMKFLLYLKEQRNAGTAVIQASGEDGIYPVYECTDYGCPDKVFCEEVGAYCHVTHCGKRECSFYPKPLPDIFKNLVFKQWCQFDCLRGSVRAGVAFGFVPSFGKGLFVGPFCLGEG